MHAIQDILNLGADMVALGRVTIGNPKFVHSLQGHNMAIVNMPYKADYLLQIGIAKNSLTICNKD